MTTTQIKVTKKKANEKTNASDKQASEKQASGKTTRASRNPGARVVEMSVKRVKREPAAGARPTSSSSAPAAKSRTAVVKAPGRRGRAA